MARVFFSFSGEDRALAERVKAALVAHHHEVWMFTDPRSDVSIVSAIELALESCDYFALFMTKNSAKSGWVRREYDAYLIKDRNDDRDTIIPLRFDDTEFHWAFLKSMEYCDLTQDFEAGLRQLLHKLPPPDAGAVEGPTQEELKRLWFAIDLSIQAGSTAMMYYNSSIKVNMALDDRRNAATEADEAAQNKIVPLIQLKYSGERIIAEEDSKDHLVEASRLHGYTWVLDPLDGTNNFVNGIPLFCTGVGVLKDGRPHIGAIYLPVQNEVYYAIDGQAARLWRIATGETLTLSTDQQVERLNASLFGTHISSRPELAEALFADDFFLNMARQVKHTRAFGCGLLALAYVASGRLQGFMQLGGYLWDQVAGVVLINSAGGVVRHFQPGSPDLAEWSCQSGNILACANEAILQEYQETLLR